MRTKNGKRIGPVPITLVAVFALAAFLSAGLLLAPNGAPTAEAQENVCEVGVAAGATPTITLPGSCDILGNTAMIKFNGAADSGDDQTLTLLIQDDNGPIRAYPAGSDWAGSPANEIQVGGSAASPMRYRYQQLIIPKAEPNPTTGVVEGKSVTITVRGNVHIWNTVTSVTEEVPNIPAATDNNPAADAVRGARRIATGAEELAPVFFGAPAIGKDSANDRNKIVDDFMQCVDDPGTVAPADLGHYTDDGETGSDRDGNEATCTAATGDIVDTIDVAESRSIVEADDLATLATADVTVIDGGEASLEPHIGDEAAATIRATIKDAKGQILEGVEVTFTATSNPANVEDRERSDDTDSTGMATHVIQGLPQSSAYRVTVVVTAEGLDDPVGTIIISRAGTLETLNANACAMLASDKTDTDMMDGCMDNYDPKMRYGTGDTVTIHAAATDSLGTDVTTNEFSVKPGTAMNWWNSLGCMEMNDAVMPMADEPQVGSDDPMANPKSPYCEMYADLSTGAKTVVDRAFDERYGDVTDALDITATGKVVADGAATFTVDDEAEGGHYLLLVEAKAGSGADRVTKTQFLRISVAGDPDSYMVNPMGTVHTMSKRVSFTVKALDENGIVPNFDTESDDRNDRVLIDALYGTVRGVDADGYLMLDTDDGMSTFTYTLPRDADMDEEFEILIGEGEMREEVTVIYGTEPDPIMVPGMPMNVMAMADGHDMINVTWEAPAADGGSAVTGYMVQSSTDGTTWTDVAPAHTGMDMMYADMGLMAETTYYYRVRAMNSEGYGDYSDGMAMAMTEMMPVVELMAPMNVATGLNTGGSVVVTWDAVDGADGYIIIAININDIQGDTVSTAVNEPDRETFGLSGLTRGETYNIFVASFNKETPGGKLSDHITVTAN